MCSEMPKEYLFVRSEMPEGYPFCVAKNTRRVSLWGKENFRRVFFRVNSFELEMMNLI